MLQAVLNKAKRWRLYGGKHPLELELAKICETADIRVGFAGGVGGVEPPHFGSRPPHFSLKK